MMYLPEQLCVNDIIDSNKICIRWYPDKMPQDKMPQCRYWNKDAAKVLQGCYKSVTRVKHGIIRMQQKCHNGVTKVLQGCNAVTWFNKDVIRVLQGCNMV